MTIQYSPKKKVYCTKFNTQRANSTLDINNDNGFVFKVKKSRKISPLEPPLNSTIPIIEPLNPKNISMDTEITLPLSDTPIAQRNIDIRASKGRRRSSLGLRGKRTTIGGEGLCCKLLYNLLCKTYMFMKICYCIVFIPPNMY